MPREIHLAGEIAAGAVNAECRVERDVAFLQILEELIPLLAVWLDEIPLPSHLAKAILLVVVVHVDRIRLDRVRLVHRLEQTVEVRHRL